MDLQESIKYWAGVADHESLLWEDVEQVNNKVDLLFDRLAKAEALIDIYVNPRKALAFTGEELRAIVEYEEVKNKCSTY